MDKKRPALKIMAIPPPATGHINPLCGIINELSKTHNLDVIFYSDEEYRGIVEKTGAQFRLYCKKTLSELPVSRIDGKKLDIGGFLGYMITYSYDLLPQLIDAFESEQFDMIIYDGFFLPSKFFMEVIKTRHARGVYAKLPKFVAFAPNFPYCESMIRRIRESQKMDAWSTLSLLNTFKRQFAFSWTYGISIYNPIKFFSASNDKINVVAVIPELQPFLDEFDDTFKFVGPCISEETRSVEITNDDELKSVLDQFETKKSGQKLIYMSLGTVFHQNSLVYDSVIEALKSFDEKPNRNFKSSQFRVIMSLGVPSFTSFKSKLASGELTLPENILIRPRVPQLEVLKRADLFISHCGFNSVTEAIKYAVPVVAIPIEADQPINARRICDELSLGVRLDPLNLTAHAIAEAIDQVLGEVKYKKNVDEMSMNMAKYNGAVVGAQLIVNYLNQED